MFKAPRTQTLKLSWFCLCYNLQLNKGCRAPWPGSVYSMRLIFGSRGMTLKIFICCKCALALWPQSPACYSLCLTPCSCHVPSHVNDALAISLTIGQSEDCLGQKSEELLSFNWLYFGGWGSLHFAVLRRCCGLQCTTEVWRHLYCIWLSPCYVGKLGTRFPLPLQTLRKFSSFLSQLKNRPGIFTAL